MNAAPRHNCRGGPASLSTTCPSHKRRRYRLKSSYPYSVIQGWPGGTASSPGGSGNPARPGIRTLTRLRALTTVISGKPGIAVSGRRADPDPGSRARIRPRTRTRSLSPPRKPVRIITTAIAYPSAMAFWCLRCRYRRITDSGKVAGTSRSDRGGTSGDGLLIVIAPHGMASRACPSGSWSRRPGRCRAPRHRAAGTAPGPDDPGTTPPVPAGAPGARLRRGWIRHDVI